MLPAHPVSPHRPHLLHPWHTPQCKHIKSRLRHHSVSLSIMKSLCWWESEKWAVGWRKRRRDVGLERCKGERFRALIIVMDEGEDAGWWLLSHLNRMRMWLKQKKCTHGMAAVKVHQKPEGISRGWMERWGTCGICYVYDIFYLKKPHSPYMWEPLNSKKCPMSIFTVKTDKSVKFKEKNHSTVMIWVQQWKIGEIQMLDWLEMQQYMTGFTTTRLWCSHRMNIWKVETENNLLLSLCVHGMCVLLMLCEGPIRTIMLVAEIASLNK